MLEKIQELVADGLGVDAEKVVPAATFKDDLGADSLDLFELVMAFEEEFGVSIPAEELEKMATVQDVMDYIEANK
ncbi:MAG: acyl carrier protein [Lachnospiraceae bacterium]|nr:acyl carrier protein [Lachnospiraceae bacterium]